MSSGDWWWGWKWNFTERWINERTSGRDAEERWENDDFESKWKKEIWSQYHRRIIHNLVSHFSAHGRIGTFSFAKYTCFKLIVFWKFYYIHLTMIYVICCQEIYTHSMYLHENQEKWNQLWISLHFLFLLVHLLIKSSAVIHFRIHFDIPSLLNESSLYIYIF